MCKCVRVYWEEVYGGLGFEVVVLKWVVLCLMVLTQMVLGLMVFGFSGFGRKVVICLKKIIKK